MKDFDKIGLIKQSWEIVKKNVQLIALLMVAFVAYQVIQGIVQSMFDQSSFMATIVSLAFTVLTLFLEIGFIKIILKLVDGHKADFKELWAYPQYLPQMIGASILYALLVGFSVVILVIVFSVLGSSQENVLLFVVAMLIAIPFVTYLAFRFQFYSYYIVDKNAGVMDSLRMSWKLTDRNMINIFIFMLILVVLNILGAIALLVGLLVTIPVSFIAVTLLYKKLQS